MGINNSTSCSKKPATSCFVKSKVSVSYRERNIKQECMPDEIYIFNLRYKVSNSIR